MTQAEERAAWGRALVVIPTYNEAENIQAILAAVGAAVPEVNVLVVDDGSPDGTGELVEQVALTHPKVHLLSGQGKQGLGRAYVSGFIWGLKEGFDLFIEMDADFSHDPLAIPSLLRGAAGNHVAVGSRYVPGGGVEGWSRGRHALSRGGNIYARLALGFKVADSTSGFRCYNRRVLEAIDLEEIRSNGYGFQIDMTYRAWQHGFSIAEVPITFREREAGVSKMSHAIVAEALLAVARWGLRDLVHRRRRPRPRIDP
ncbi:MAG: polyprenol monophosphomannose synthase [Actinomycetota bacterium]